MPNPSDLELWDQALAAIPPFTQTCIYKAIRISNSPSFYDFVLETVEADAAACKPGPLSALLLRDLVAAAVSSPKLLSLEEALRLARAASRIDNGVDYKILAHVVSSNPHWPDDVRQDEVMRALTVVDEISDCRRLVVPLIKFAKLNDPHLRSKAVKLMARGNTNAHWADVVLSDPNPRVRANLVEELAAQIGHKAEPLLRKGALDPHHRVATSSLLALCRLGDESSRERLEKLAVEGDEMFRRASAWALTELDRAPGVNPSTTSPHPSA